MKKLIISVLALAAASIIFWSCNKNNTMEFEKIDYSKVIRSAAATDTTSGYCSVNILLHFPSKFKSTEVLEKIQQQILTYSFDSSYTNYTGKQAVDSFAISTFDNYTYFINEAIKRKVSKDNLALLHNEEWKMNTLVLYNDNGILSYELNRYSFAGGAHGMETTQFLVFDLNTGNKLTEHDVFVEGFEPKMADLLKKQLMFDNGFENEEHMLTSGYFSAENIAPNGNFSLTEEGITYIFNPYEIGAYSLGQTEITVPFAKIKSVLKKDSPIQALIEAKPEKE